MTGWKMLQPNDMFGDLRVLKELGRGGMGAVYLVMDEESGSKYAAKILFPEAEAKDHDNAVGRFLREAEVAMAIDHPNLVKVYDYGRDPETGLGFILMDFISGGSLYDRFMHRMAQGDGPFKVKEAVSIIRQMAEVLSVAEEHGIVHRDIKLDNILFDENGNPYLADLGVAKRTGIQATMTLTMTDMVVGTPAYMSPEQLTDSKHVDIRADIYSLGIVLWHLLAGELPYDDSSMTALLARAVKKTRIPDIRTKRPKVSRKIALLLRKMTAPRVEQRFQHPAEIIAFLDEYAAHERKILRWAIVGCSVAFVLAFGGTAWFAWRMFDKPIAREEGSAAAAVAAVAPKRALPAQPSAGARVPACQSATTSQVTQTSTAAKTTLRAHEDTRPYQIETNRVEVDARPSGSRIAGVSTSIAASVPTTVVETVAMLVPKTIDDFLKEYKDIKSRPDSDAVLTKAVNAARRIDPDFSQYNWKGEPLEDGVALTNDELIILRRGLVYRQCEIELRRSGKIPESARLIESIE